jgi:hypothetical protein
MPAWAPVDSPVAGLGSGKGVDGRAASPVDAGGCVWDPLGDVETLFTLVVLVALEVAVVVEEVVDEAAPGSGVLTTYAVLVLSQRAQVLGLAGRTSNRPTPLSQQPADPAQQ